MEQYRIARSKADGLKLSIMEVIPDGEVKGVLQIVHGMQEHKERYLHFMEFLAEHGYASICHDHRGHGHSVKDVRDLGYFYENGSDAIVEDLNAVAGDMLLRYPHVPYFMLGHSMGSLIVRKYLKKYDDRLAGLIITGAVYKNPAYKAALRAVKTMKKVKGDRYMSKTIAAIMDGTFDHGLDGDLKNRWLSVNEENVKAFNEDPLSGIPFTLNAYEALFTLIEDVYSPDGWQMKNKTLPILFLAGEEDPVIGGAKAYQETVQDLKNKGYTNVQSRLYPNMRHEILNEINKMEVYDVILAFLEDNSK